MSIFTRGITHQAQTTDRMLYVYIILYIVHSNLLT